MMQGTESHDLKHTEIPLAQLKPEEVDPRSLEITFQGQAPFHVGGQKETLLLQRAQTQTLQK